MLTELPGPLCSSVLFWLDEGALGALASTARSPSELSVDPALWRRLALQRDPRGVWLALGGSFQVGESRDWRALCRQLNPQAAELSWPGAEAAAGSGVWREPRRRGQDGGAAGSEPSAELGPGSLWAGQSPHMFWIGAGRLLSVAGGYYTDNLGGAEVRPLHDVLLLELPDNSTVSAEDLAAASAELRVTTLIPGPGANGDGGAQDAARPDNEHEQMGHPHLHGAAGDFDAAGCRAIFFGGGAPHGQLTDASSALTLDGGVEGPDGALQDLRAAWQPIPTLGERPSPRQGVRGVVFEDRFVIFGGRERGGQCLNDVWALGLAPDRDGRHMWHQIDCEGQAPSPRVWYAACHATHGQWFVLGGSEWQFEDVERPHDYRTLYVLDLGSMRWSTVAGPSPAGPPAAPGRPPSGGGEEQLPWAVAPALLPLGSRQLLYLGGCQPHQLGPDGLVQSNMQNWRRWYTRLDRPFVFDRATGRWEPRMASVGDLQPQASAEAPTSGDAAEVVSEVLLRSHIAAAYMPDRGSVVVLGGSRYFTGEYFHDFLELRLQVGDEPSVLVGELPRRPPRFMERASAGDGSRVTRGLRGRLRGMVREGFLDEAQYLDVLARF